MMMGGIILLQQLSMSVFAQSNEVKNLEGTIQWGVPKEGYAMSLSITNQEIAPEQAVVLTVKVKNISQKELLLIESGPGADFNFIVKDAAGKEAPKLRYQLHLEANEGVYTSNVVMSMKPGQVIEYQQNVSRRFDMSLSGKYTVQAYRNVVRKAGHLLVEIKSNILGVRIQ